MLLNIIVIALFIFFGTNVLGKLGIEQNTFNVFLFSLSFFSLLPNISNILKNKSLTALLFFVTFYSLWMMATDKGEGTRACVMAIVGAPLLFSALPINNKKDSKYWNFWRYIMMIVAIGFIVETALAIFERIYGQSILGWYGEIIFSIDMLGSSGFRSTALYGHPLGNALIVSTMMSFILISKLKYSIKYPLWFLGYISILCFNTRGSIVGNALLFIVYHANIFFLNKRMSDSSKVSMFLLTIIIVCGGYISIFYLGLGGRLLNMGLLDESSAQVRVDAWTIFDFYSIEDFLFGHTHEEVMLIQYRVGYYKLENPWLGILLRNGFFFLILYIVLYFFLIKKLLKEYGLFDKFFVSATYFLLASTSNSFDTSFNSLYYFLLLSVLFTPSMFESIVKRNYLM